MSTLLALANKLNRLHQQLMLLDRLHQKLALLEAAEPYRPMPLPDEVRYPKAEKLIKGRGNRTRKGKDIPLPKLSPLLQGKLRQTASDNETVHRLNRDAGESARECLVTLKDIRPVLELGFTPAEYSGLQNALQGISTTLGASFANSWEFKPPVLGATMANGKATPPKVVKLWKRHRAAIDAMRHKVRRLWEQGINAATRPARGTTKLKPTLGDDGAMYDYRALAKLFKLRLKLNALRKRLDRWRKDHPDEVGKAFVVAEDRRRGTPATTYRLGSVRHIMNALKAKRSTSGRNVHRSSK